MRILLIRHGESTGNRDGIWAGITNNELTVHGFDQATRLGIYLKKQYADTPLVAIYASDLTRARRTAQAVADAFSHKLEVTKLLREQDLGWREGLTFKAGDRALPANAARISSHPGESKDDMDIRAGLFINEIKDSLTSSDGLLIIVSHGLFLIRLYYKLCTHLEITLPPPVSWYNTGITTILTRESNSVVDVNAIDHLKGLKRARHVSRAEYSPKQQKVSDFFKKVR